MPRYVALLRAVNVGGHNRLPMAAFRALLESLGATQAETYLQSGNAVFSGARAASKTWAKRVGKALATHCALRVDVIVLTEAEMRAARDANPFARRKDLDGATFHVTFLAAEPTAAALTKLQAAVRGEDEFRCDGRVLYLYLPKGYSKSTLTGVVVERALGMSTTSRNWRTVCALADMTETAS